MLTQEPFGTQGLLGKGNIGNLTIGIRDLIKFFLKVEFKLLKKKSIEVKG